MIAFRIYRMSGDREWWRIDTGEGTTVVRAKSFVGAVRTVNGPLTKQPVAWLELHADFLHIVDDAAVFGWKDCK